MNISKLTYCGWFQNVGDIQRDSIILLLLFKGRSFSSGLREFSKEVLSSRFYDSLIAFEERLRELASKVRETIRILLSGWAIKSCFMKEGLNYITFPPDMR